MPPVKPPVTPRAGVSTTMRESKEADAYAHTIGIARYRCVFVVTAGHSVMHFAATSVMPGMIIDKNPDAT